MLLHYIVYPYCMLFAASSRQGGRIRGGCTVISAVTVHIRSMQLCMYQVCANALIGRRHERLPLQQSIHLEWCSMRAYYEQHCGLYAVPSPEYKQYPRSAQLERLKYSQLIMHESSRMLLCRFVKERRRCVFWTFCSSNAKLSFNHSHGRTHS